VKSMYVDWQSEFSKKEWEFVGRQVLLFIKGEWSEKNPGGVSEDDGYPIYNYAYPLHRDHFNEETVLEICEVTNCTVVYSNQQDKYFLALTGCGMDMSQDIALAYLIADGCIDWDMLEDVYIAGPLSVSQENYLRLMRELDRQLGIEIGNLKSRHKEVQEKLMDYVKRQKKTRRKGGGKNRS
jgi:hypothetical protein